MILFDYGQTSWVEVSELIISFKIFLKRKTVEEKRIDNVKIVITDEIN